jgi:hypothetical protein
MDERYGVLYVKTSGWPSRRTYPISIRRYRIRSPGATYGGRLHDDPGGRGGAERARQLRRRRGVNVGFAGLLVSVNRGREPVYD